MKNVLKRALALISVCALATPMAVIAACNGNGGANNSGDSVNTGNTGDSGNTDKTDNSDETGDTVEEMPSIPTQVDLPEVAIENAFAKLDEMLEKFEMSKNCSFNHIVRLDEFYTRYEEDGTTLAENYDNEHISEMAYKYLETDKPYAKCVVNVEEKSQVYLKAIPGNNREEFNDSRTSKGKIASYLCGDALSVVNSIDREENGETTQVPEKLVDYYKQDWGDNEAHTAKYKANYAACQYGGFIYGGALYSAKYDIKDYLHYLDLKSKNQPYMPLDPLEGEEDYAYDMKKYTCTLKADETRLYFEWERVYVVNSYKEVSAYEKIYLDNATEYKESNFTTDVIPEESVKDVCYIDVDRAALKADLLANKEIAIDIKGGGNIEDYAAVCYLANSMRWNIEAKVEDGKIIIPADTILSLRAYLGIKDTEPINDQLVIVFDNYYRSEDDYKRSTYIHIPL